MAEYKILSNSNPEVATFTLEDGRIIVHAHSPGSTILTYDRDGYPVPHRVDVS